MNHPSPTLKPHQAALLWLVESGLLFSCYVLVAYQVPQVDGEFYLYFDNGFWQIAALVLVVQIGLSIQFFYRVSWIKSKVDLVLRLCSVFGVAFLYEALATLYFPPLALPRSVMLFGSVLALVVFPVWRAAVTALIRATSTPRRLIFIGSSPSLQAAVELAKAAPQEFTVLGYVDAPNGKVPLATQRLGSANELDEILAEQQPTHLVIATRWRSEQLQLRTLLDVQWSGLSLEGADSFYESYFRRVAIHDLRFSDFLFSSVFQRPNAVLWMLSPALGAVLSLALLPVCLPLALIVRFSSSGEVLLREKLLGEGGKLFWRYRFHASPEHSTGRWMQRYGLHRIPEFWNMALGHITLIGPAPQRPELFDRVCQEIPFYRGFSGIKPGMFGWAQINMNDQNEPFPDLVKSLQYDLYYLRRRNLAVDTYIVLHSLLA